VPRILAHMALRVLLDRIRQRPDAHTLVKRLGQGAQLEIQLAVLERRSRDTWEQVEALGLGGRTMEFVTTLVESLIDRFHLPKNWSAEATYNVGGWLLAQAVEHCRIDGERIFDKAVGDPDPTFTTTGGVQWDREVRYVLTAIAQKIVEEGDTDYITSGRDDPPMPYEPKPWTSMFEGGYHTLPTPFVTRRLPMRTLDASAEGRESLTVPMAAATALGKAAWRVNARVLQVLRFVVKRAEDGMHDPFELQGNDDRRRAYVNVRDAASRFSCDTFHLAHHIDFRGRYGPLASRLHFQSASYERALLLFAEPKPLGTVEAYRWFMRAGAAALGNDKLSIDDQLASVDNPFVDEDVEAINADPFANRDLWQRADDPWTFLAWAFERARYLKEKRKAKVDDDDAYLAFETALPVSLDGSCNALQHLALLTRSREDAERVNLLPPTSPYCSPRDLYGEVADAVTTKLQALAHDPGAGNEALFARAWIATGLVGRSLAKTPVMTVAYGSTSDGRQRTLRDALRESSTTRKILADYRVSVRSAATFLEKLLMEAFEAIVADAVPAMDFLRKCASIVARAGHDLAWRSPSGLLVHQFERRPEKIAVRTRLHGTTDWSGSIDLTLLEDGSTVDSAKASRSVAPNFVHSLDAAHLTRVILRAYTEGIPLGPVHDAVRVRPSDAEAIQRILLEELAAMYGEADLLDDFRNQLAEQFPDIAGELPHVEDYVTRGDLDPTEIVGAAFAFA
jgi:DNA-directed RNA polymerase